jgi:succinate dehydrogenase / fumarate reductase, iron-sulfur subunit
MRVWRGDADRRRLQGLHASPSAKARSCSTSSTAIQAQQAGDLAVRWNCKAGKCGSCSAEVNGKPRLMCMTRMNTTSTRRNHHRRADEDFSYHPGPGHRRLFNYEKAKEVPAFKPKPERSRRQAPHDQEDIDRGRSSTSASSASCARTSATSSATMRRTSRPLPARASSCACRALEMHPLDTNDRRS